MTPTLWLMSTVLAAATTFNIISAKQRAEFLKAFEDANKGNPRIPHTGGGKDSLAFTSAKKK